MTLTFDHKRIFPVRRAVASREAFRWCGELGRMLRREIAWVYAPERGRNGQWHAHVLVAGANTAELRTPAAVWRTRNGFVGVKEVHNRTGVALYTSKQAAATAEIVWSENLGLYRGALASRQTVALHPADAF